MQTVKAIYSHGKFEPEEPVALSENQRVQLTIRTESSETRIPDWLIELRTHREQLRSKYGLFPDSTAIIREDRDKR